MRLSDEKRLVMEKLSKKGIENPSLEAFLLIEELTGLDRTGQILHSDMEIADDSALRSMLERRLSGVPMAYILGHREFYGLDFIVNDDVLIPRPDTETLVEEGISFLRTRKGAVLDLCTGSGCVGISVAKNTGLPVVLSDLSPRALDVARENAERHIPGRYEIVQGDLFSSLKGRRFAAILSNPPSLTEEWYSLVSEEVRREPRSAFLGFDSDGLGLIRRIVLEAGEYLENNALLAIECDYRQTEECARLLESSGFVDVGILRDLSGLERCVRGIYPDAT